MKKVMVATPTIDGKLECHYVSSLMQTIKDAARFRIEVLPLFVAYDSLVQRARNDLIYHANVSDVDEIIFIDADTGWNPEDFIRLVLCDEDVVAGLCPIKTDMEKYHLKALEQDDYKLTKNAESGLCEVEGIGCAFMKVSRKAIEAIWEASKPYIDRGDIEKRMVFDVVVDGVNLISEDIYFCQKLRELGFKIWIDPSITCNHTGVKTHVGNFDSWASINGFYKQSE